MSDFQCPICRRPLNVNKRLSDLKNRKNGDRIYFYVCNRQSKQSPHGPCIWKLDTMALAVDSFGRYTMKVARVFRVWIEDSDLYDLLDEFRIFMEKERGNRLKAKMNSDAKSVQRMKGRNSREA